MEIPVQSFGASAQPETVVSAAPLNGNLRQFADIRFKLLTLAPTLGGAATFGLGKAR
jgi:hypothetical protein